jgi:transcriptional regulator with XRE-family HTH domain
VATRRRTFETQFYHWTIDRDVLRLLIQRRGLTPYSLAMESGVDKRVIYRLLNGERKGTTFPTAEAIAHVLRIDVALFADPAMRWVPLSVARSG